MTNHVASDAALDAALSSAREVAPLPLEVVDALDLVVRKLEDAEQRESLARELDRVRRGRGRRWKLIVPLAVLGLLIGVPVGATAISSWTAHTGVFGGTGSEVVDRSEWIGLDADDAPEAIIDLYPAYLELPEGATRDDVIRPVAELMEVMGTVPEGESGHVGIQASAIRVVYENAARCLWYREWLDADAHDDAGRREAAAAGLVDALSWPATVESDGGGVVDLLVEQSNSANAGARRDVLSAYKPCAGFYGEVTQ